MTGCPNGCARPYLAEIGSGGSQPWYLQSLSGRRVRRLADEQAVPPRRGWRRDRGGVGAAAAGLRRRPRSPASGSATTPSAPAISARRPPATGSTTISPLNCGADHAFNCDRRRLILPGLRCDDARGRLLGLPFVLTAAVPGIRVRLAGERGGFDRRQRGELRGISCR